MEHTRDPSGSARNFQFAAKRVFDLIIAATALAVISPLFLLAAVVIKIDSCGPIFIGQIRYCYNNRTIHVLKFRPPFLNEETESVTRAGRVLVRSGIDRLPILINVLRAELSIVGPCTYEAPPLTLLADALPDALLQSYPIPGIICAGKINSRGTHEPQTHIRQQLTDDLSYVTNWSLSVDVKIILKRLSSVASYKLD
jgi:lipopolysaccharide/colanic/teichoic acid biosynthesis glycosyltransferase